MKNSIEKRLKSNINLEQFNDLNEPEFLTKLNLEISTERLYILRMLIKDINGDFKIPNELKFLTNFINICYENQKKINSSNPYCYVTIRSGLVTSTEDDEWHVDGFSMKIPHIPEQNYIWTNVFPTEYTINKVKIPLDFNPLEHNIHEFLSRNIESEIHTCEENSIYVIDPYILHRRPTFNSEVFRTFIRVSFTPIEINDVNNTLNPLIETNYVNDGLVFRKNLKKY